MAIREKSGAGEVSKIPVQAGEVAFLCRLRRGRANTGCPTGSKITSNRTGTARRNQDQNVFSPGPQKR